MDKENKIYLETERCKGIINSELEKVYYKCLSQRTIKQSNQLFETTLNKAKKKAFDSITSVVKPYVVYRVNNFFKFN